MVGAIKWKAHDLDSDIEASALCAGILFFDTSVFVGDPPGPPRPP